MAAINYIYNNSPVLSAQIDNTNMQQSTKQRTKREHIISITHYEINGVYDGSIIEFHWSYQKKLNYKHIDIFSDTAYNNFIKSYQNRDTIHKGVIISYAVPVEKEGKRTYTKPAVKKFTISDDIYIELEQPHYTIDSSDTNWFRISNCIFHDHVFPTRQLHWVQRQNRPALYVNSLDCTARFDSNSVFVYINKYHVKKKLKSLLRAISFGKLEREDKLNKEREFANIWYLNTLLLWYINWSWSDEWHVKTLNYETFLNLGYYLLWNIDFFDNKEEDSMVGVKQTYIEFLFMKNLWNDCSKGLKHTFRDKVARSIQKETRYMFPKGYGKLQKAMFKVQFPSPTQDRILERNKQIKELHNQGKGNKQIAKEVNCSTKTIQRILKNIL